MYKMSVVAYLEVIGDVVVLGSGSAIPTIVGAWSGCLRLITGRGLRVTGGLVERVALRGRLVFSG
jgi:hypothetical protein